MAFTIDSGFITPGVLYRVFGSSATVTYDGTTYNEGDVFRGTTGASTFTVTGGATVQEVLELAGGQAEFQINATDQPVYAETLRLQGMAIEFERVMMTTVLDDLITAILEQVTDE